MFFSGLSLGILPTYFVARLTLSFLDVFSGLSLGILPTYFVGRLTVHPLDILSEISIQYFKRQ